MVSANLEAQQKNTLYKLCFQFVIRESEAHVKV